MADLLTADGIGVVHASKILKKPISERAAGYDIARQVLQKMNYTDHKLFLFGGKPGIAEGRQRKSFEDTPTLILSVQETDISSRKKRLKLLRKSTIPVRILFLYA